MSITNYELLSFQDAVDHTLDQVTGNNSTPRNRRQAVRAVLDAYHEIPARRRWRYYWRPDTIQTVAKQNTGSIAYDYCVTPEHEALTRTGWKTHDQLQVGEEILAYDHFKGVCCWRPVEAIHVFDYQGDILEVVRKGRPVLRCTPNHRIPVYERRGRAKVWRKRWITAKELTTEHVTPLAAPIYEESAGQLDARLAGLLSWCVTDGTGLFNRRYYKAEVLQSISANPEKCGAIAALTGRPGLPIGRDGMYRFPLLPEDRRKIRSLVIDKDDLTRIVCQMGRRQAEATVQSMIAAEASTSPNGSVKTFTQWGDNKPVADAFQVACLLTGRAANLSVGEYGGKTRYQLPVRTSNGIKLGKQSHWVQYSGKVWCPQVSTTAWVVRCNGAVMITGNSGGTYERMVTLTGSTWPTDVDTYAINIAGARYGIEAYKDSTTITLRETDCPTADIASGTAYAIVKDTYPLPDTLRTIDYLYDVYAPGRMLPQVQPDDIMRERRLVRTSAVPLMYAVYRNERYASGMALHFAPSCTSVRTYQFYAQYWPLPLKVLDYNVGTATTTSASTTVTGSGTTWTSAMVGAVMRFSSSTKNPTPLMGEIDKDLLNPYTMQGVVRSVESTTSLTLEQAADQSLSGVGYTISSRVDIEPGAMRNAFLRGCEAFFSPQDRKGRQERLAEYERALEHAMYADQRSIESPGTMFIPHTLADVAASINNTVGGP